MDKGFGPEDIEETINFLNEYKLINEEEFIRSRTRALIRKDLGDEYIIQKCLSEKLAITQTIIDEERDYLGISQEDQLKNLLQKKLGLKKLEELDYKEKTKVLRYLNSKGHSTYSIDL